MADPNDPGPADRPDGPSGPGRDRSNSESSGLFGALRRLAGALVDVEAGAGRREHHAVEEGENARFEYHFGVSTVEELVGEQELGTDGESETGSEYGRLDPPTRVNEGEEGVVVNVDLPEVEGDTVAAGVDGTTLVVGVGNEVLTRVELPRRGLEVQYGRYNNGVLEFFLRDPDATADEEVEP